MRTISAIRGDVFGGATAAVVALPLALAFGVASGAGPLAGLYGAIFAGFLAARFGGTPVQVTGPTGPMTVVMALVVTHFAGNLPSAFATVMLAGALQILFGKLKLGRFVKLTPQPVVSGFMSGIGAIIIIVQLAPIIGHADPSGSVLEKLAAVTGMLTNVNGHAVAVTAAVLAILYLTPKSLARIVPTPLIALVAGTAAVAWFNIDVPVIGEIPLGLPTIIVPEIALSDVQYIIRFALILAFLGSIDSLLTSIVADSMTRTQHDSNRELVGQGFGNIVAGLLGGLPSAGATMRTLVNVRAGGTSWLSGAIHSGLLLLLVMGFGSVVQHIPLAALAGILVKVGIDIIDWNALRRIPVAPRAGVVIMLTTLLITVFVDLITAVAVGFVMASVLFVARTAEAQINSAKFVFGADQIDDLSDAEKRILDECGSRLVLFHLEGPLSFGSARDVARLILSDIDKDVLAIDMRDVPFVDSSASAALDEVIERLTEDGDSVLIFGARERVIETLRQTGVLERLGRERLFRDRLEALEYGRALIIEPAPGAAAGNP